MPLDPADRTIPGLPNARDLGGLRAGGATTRRGRLLRSAAPLLPGHAAEIARLGVVAVVDLRGAAEVERQPNAAPAGLVRHFDVLADAPQDAAAALAPLAASLMARGPDGPPADLAAISTDLRGLMLQSYRDFVVLPSARAALTAALRTILAAQGPVLLHCTAGKDRTGWLAAVLLDLAGVPWDAITADYLASGPAVQEIFAPFRQAMASRGIDPEVLEPLLAVDAGWLAVARGTAEELHGSMEAYMRQGLGLSGDEVEALRRVLLD